MLQAPTANAPLLQPHRARLPDRARRLVCLTTACGSRHHCARPRAETHAQVPRFTAARSRASAKVQPATSVFFLSRHLTVTPVGVGGKRHRGTPIARDCERVKRRSVAQSTPQNALRGIWPRSVSWGTACARKMGPKTLVSTVWVWWWRHRGTPIARDGDRVRRHAVAQSTLQNALRGIWPRSVSWGTACARKMGPKTLVSTVWVWWWRHRGTPIARDGDRVRRRSVAQSTPQNLRQGIWPRSVSWGTACARKTGPKHLGSAVWVRRWWCSPQLRSQECDRLHR